MSLNQKSILDVRDNFTLELYGNTLWEVLKYSYEDLGLTFLEPLEVMRSLTDLGNFNKVMDRLRKNQRIPAGEMEVVKDFIIKYDSLRVHKIDLYPFLESILAHVEAGEVSSESWTIHSTNPSPANKTCSRSFTVDSLSK